MREYIKSVLSSEADGLRIVASESIETVDTHDKLHEKQKENPFIKYLFYVRFTKKFKRLYKCGTDVMNVIWKKAIQNTDCMTVMSQKNFC